MALVAGGVIINIPPGKAKIDKAGYVPGKDRRLLVTAGETFYLDINEFGLNR